MTIRARWLGHIVRFVDQHAVPMRAFQEMPIATDVLERVDTDDDAMIDLKRILVGRNPQPQLRDAAESSRTKGIPKRFHISD